MNHFERNFASIFGPESNRRKLTPENNRWKRREQYVAERKAIANQMKKWDRNNAQETE